VPNPCYGTTSTWARGRRGEREGEGKNLFISSILALPDAHTSLQSEETINTL